MMGAAELDVGRGVFKHLGVFLAGDGDQQSGMIECHKAHLGDEKKVLAKLLLKSEAVRWAVTG